MLTRLLPPLAALLVLAGCAQVGLDPAPPATSSRAQDPAGCRRPTGVVAISFSATKYPRIRAHTERAIARGWPTVLVLHRTGTDQRRARLLRDVPTRSGDDRDEYPPAVGRARWKADVAYVPSGENRSHGSVLGLELRRYCSGTRFRYVFS